METTKFYIIDDNESVCHALKFLLDSAYNLPVELYHNPLQFLKEYRPNWRGCLVIDLFLPFMDGLELLDELKQRGNQVPIIVITGHGDRLAQQQALKKGAHSFFTKPFKVEKLLKKLEEILALPAISTATPNSTREPLAMDAPYDDLLAE